MRRDAPRIGVELVLLGLVLAALGGSLTLVVQMHRRSTRPSASAAPVIVAQPATVDEPKPAPPPRPVEVVEPAPIDLTPGRIAAIAEKLESVEAEAASARKRSDSLEVEIQAAVAEIENWRAREESERADALAKAKAAQRAEADLDVLARERDALIVERDATRATIERERLRARDGVAVLPYKGPNGTWRRPIAIECRGSTATVRPKGPTFTMRDLAGFSSPRSNPLVMEVARAMVRTRTIATPDGAPSVPYLLFVVRPDGIRPFYAARMILEPLGIEYGYELADADWDIEFPDLDDPSEWSEQSRAKRSPNWPPPPTQAEGSGPGTFARGPGGFGRGGVGGLASPSFPGPIAIAPGATHATDANELGGLVDVAPGGADDVPNDGRIPWQPGPLEEPPSFEATPASSPEGGRGIAGNTRNSDSKTADNGRLLDVLGRPRSGAGGSPINSTTQPGRALDRGPGTSAVVSEWPDQSGQGDRAGSGGHSLPAGGNRALREAIARREGLVAPTMPALPNRSGGASAPSGDTRSAASTAGGAASGTQPSTSASPPSGGGTGSGSESGQGTGDGSSGGWSGRGLVSRSLPITVACDRDGVTVHPGGTVISLAELNRDDSLLPVRLRAIVEGHRQNEPDVGFRTRVTFLIKPGGESTYLKARWQASVGTNYPQSFRMVDAGGPRLLGPGGR